MNVARQRRIAVYRDDARRHQLSNDVEEATPANTGRLAFSDRNDLNLRVVTDPEAFNRPLPRSHAKGDIHPFESRAGRGGSRPDPAVPGNGNLTVGADVDEENRPFLLPQPRGSGSPYPSRLNRKKCRPKPPITIKTRIRGNRLIRLQIDYKENI